jgi:hypothetical protein
MKQTQLSQKNGTLQKIKMICIDSVYYTPHHLLYAIQTIKLNCLL